MAGMKPTCTLISVRKKGFYALVDAIIDSQEYTDCFGEDTVPYERYLTPAGQSLRSLRVGSIQDKGARVEEKTTPRFIELGTVSSESRPTSNQTAHSSRGDHSARTNQTV